MRRLPHDLDGTPEGRPGRRHDRARTSAVRRLTLAAVVAAAVVPFAGSASATCTTVDAKGRASAGYCDEQDYWVWCAGAGVTGVAGVGFCQYERRTGIWMGCWTFQGLHCN